jgi:hypothetical protein
LKELPSHKIRKQEEILGIEVCKVALNPDHPESKHLKRYEISIFY